MSISGIIIGILIFAAGALFLIRELKNAPTYPDDFCRDDETDDRRAPK